MKLKDTITRLKSIPTNKWHIHEAVLCRKLGMAAQDGLSVRRQLSNLVSALQKGHSGDRRRGTYESTGLPVMNLGDIGTANALNVHFTVHGYFEPFPTDSLQSSSTVSARPRYFSFGTNSVPIATQLSIVKLVTGTDSTLDAKTAKRRQDLWKSWYEKDRNAAVVFEKEDLPTIVEQFPSVWDKETIPSKVCADIRSLILQQLHCFSNKSRWWKQ